ncbi:hypothetical protein NP233_g12377 [Leucocoprinus birnbaumii]|uniref:Uncharacterized protein n=1 Tax=Leucocoprinus birnbaumii TaxID=56174 RepID=A0AAD5VH45_9AGAR|nr:hypothetical protein NP233_g12377 [Leucocoprinus birnbaumii]
MGQGKQRVSYVIPPPQDPDSIPRLSLPPPGTPRLGSVGPLLIPLSTNEPITNEHLHSHSTQRPRHRLGVASLALDTSAQLVGRSSPEGILYTGGRDGLVISWDLGVPTRRRAQRGSMGRWELMTGWADDVVDDDDGQGGDVGYPRRR